MNNLKKQLESKILQLEAKLEVTNHLKTKFYLLKEIINLKEELANLKISEKDQIITEKDQVIYQLNDEKASYTKTKLAEIYKTVDKQIMRGEILK